MTSTNSLIDFINIGTPKSGTTWINVCLSEHPEVCVSKRKEIHFFSNKEHWEGFWTPDMDNQYQRGFDWYMSHFKDCKAGSIKGEVGTFYMYDPESAKLIYKANPAIKILVILRNPVDRLYSHYIDVKAKNRYELPDSFEKLIEDETFLKTGKYAVHIMSYLDIFPKENIGIFIYDDLKSRPKDFIKSIYKFLEVDSSFKPSVLNKKINKTGPEELKAKIFANINQLEEKRLGKSIIKLLKITGTYKLFGKVLLPFINQKDSYVQMKKETRMKLNSYYADDIRQLEKIIGRDLTFWN